MTPVIEAGRKTVHVYTVRTLSIPDRKPCAFTWPCVSTAHPTNPRDAAGKVLWAGFVQNIFVFFPEPYQHLRTSNSPNYVEKNVKNTQPQKRHSQEIMCPTNAPLFLALQAIMLLLSSR